MIRWHRPALRFDLLRAGVRLEDFLAGRISWNVTWDVVSEILREPSSHTVSALNGDKYVPAPSERAAWATFEAWLNTQRRKGTNYRRVPRPWHGDKPSYMEKDSPRESDERQERRKRLAELF